MKAKKILEMTVKAKWTEVDLTIRIDLKAFKDHDTKCVILHLNGTIYAVNLQEKEAIRESRGDPLPLEPMARAIDGL